MLKIFANPKLCAGCGLCCLACSVRRFGAVNPRYSGISIARDLFSRYEGQFICRQCEDPRCAAACFSGAMRLDSSTGVTVPDPGRCLGCGSCAAACPHGSIVMLPMKGTPRPVSFKCTRCAEDDTPSCVLVCPTGALRLG